MKYRIKAGLDGKENLYYLAQKRKYDTWLCPWVTLGYRDSISSAEKCIKEDALKIPPKLGVIKMYDERGLTMEFLKGDGS